MKKLLILAASLVMVTSCQKESIQSNNLLSDIERAPDKNIQVDIVYRPMFVNFYAEPDFTAPPVPCFPDELGTMYVSGGSKIFGTATHLGIIDPQLSKGTIIACNFGPGAFEITTFNTGQIAAANGDLMYFKSKDITNILTGNFAGVVEVKNGTGRFAKALGMVNIQGTVNFQTGVVKWKGDGFVAY